MVNEDVYIVHSRNRINMDIYFSFYCSAKCEKYFKSGVPTSSLLLCVWQKSSAWNPCGHPQWGRSGPQRPG